MDHRTSVTSWLKTCWKKQTAARTPFATLFDHYVLWCEGRKIEPAPRAWVGRLIGEALDCGPTRCRLNGVQVRTWQLTPHSDVHPPVPGTVDATAARGHLILLPTPDRTNEDVRTQPSASDLAVQVARDLGFDLDSVPHPRLEPPDDLDSPDAVRLWLEIIGDALACDLDDDDGDFFEIWNGATLHLLRSACESYGRMQRAAHVLKAEAPAGVYYVDGQPRTHPAHKVWADSLSHCTRLLDRLVDGLPLALAQTVTDRGHRHGVGT